MILARGLAERHLRGGLVFPFGQNVAPLHLDRLAQPSRLVAAFRQRQQLGATQSYIMSLPIALQTPEPRGPAAPVPLKKKPFAIYLSARIRNSWLARDRCELGHSAFPTYLPHLLGAPKITENAP